MDSNGILSLLGLALRGGNLVVGEDAADDATQARNVRLLLLASDAAPSTCRRVTRMAQAGECLWVRLPFSKAELGPALGRASAAVAAVTDIGLAGAVARRLAELDSAQYGHTAERLDLKAKRSAERKARQGTRKKTAAEKPRSETSPSAKPVKTEPRKSASREGSPNRSGTLRTFGGTHGKPEGRISGDSRGHRSKPHADRFAHSRPVKKGKGSFRKKEGAAGSN